MRHIWVFRQIGTTHVIQTSERAMADNQWTVSRQGEFFSLGMILKYKYESTVTAGIGWFVLTGTVTGGVANGQPRDADRKSTDVTLSTSCVFQRPTTGAFCARSRSNCLVTSAWGNPFPSPNQPFSHTCSWHQRTGQSLQCLLKVTTSLNLLVYIWYLR